jgi:hypothetical protein
MKHKKQKIIYQLSNLCLYIYPLLHSNYYLKRNKTLHFEFPKFDRNIFTPQVYILAVYLNSNCSLHHGW